MTCCRFIIGYHDGSDIMPKQTFINLPENKKEKIMEAARKEFSRVSFYEASISNIIKEAGISRGSFYQYFEDKEDAFFFTMKDFSNIYEAKFEDFLKNTEGDVIQAFILLYEFLLEFFQSDQNRGFFKNAFLNMSHRMEQTMAKGMNSYIPCKNADDKQNQVERGKNKENKNKEFQRIIDLVDVSKLNIKTNEDIFTVFRILVTLTMSNIVESFAKQLSFEESVELYKKQIDLIKNGVYKDTQNTITN